MTLTLRSHRNPRLRAERNLPQWPADRIGEARMARIGDGVSSRSEAHAAEVWRDARFRTVQQAHRAQGTGNPKAMLELFMVSEIANHLRDCRRCWQHGVATDDLPAEWLTWAAGKTSLRPLVKAVMAEQGRKVPPHPPRPRKRSAAKSAGRKAPKGWRAKASPGLVPGTAAVADPPKLRRPPRLPSAPAG